MTITKINSCLIVDDHHEARQWLSQAANAAFSGVQISHAGTLKEANAICRQMTPEMALIDIGLPDGSGLELVDKLDQIRRAKNLTMTLIVSTVMNDDQTIFDAIRRGADGYLLKEESRASLIEMLHGIAEGKPPLSASVARRLLSHFRSDESSTGNLAPREREVLQLIAKGHTVARVAELMEIKYYTAASYVREIYQKLNINSRAEATLEASKRGLV